MRNWHKEKNQGKRKSQFSWGDVSWWQLNVEERRLDRWFGSKVEGFSVLMDWWLWGQTQLSWNQEAGCKDSCYEYCDSWPAWESRDADLCQLRRDELRGLSNSTMSLERWLSSHVCRPLVLWWRKGSDVGTNDKDDSFEVDDEDLRHNFVDVPAEVGEDGGSM